MFTSQVTLRTRIQSDGDVWPHVSVYAKRSLLIHLTFDCIFKKKKKISKEIRNEVEQSQLRGSQQD